MDVISRACYTTRTMKHLLAAFTALALLTHANLGICAPWMGQMPGASMSTGASAPMDPSQAASHLTGLCDCMVGALDHLAPAALTALEPSGFLYSNIASAPRVLSLPRIDPPPRLSFI